MMTFHTRFRAGSVSFESLNVLLTYCFVACSDGKPVSTFPENARAAPVTMSQKFAVAYGIAAFVLTFAFFTHFVVFLGNLPRLSEPWVTPSIDVGPTTQPILAAMIDIGLVGLFGLQHSMMARPSFKSWWTQVVPDGLERSTYVLAAGGAGFILLVFWQPIPFVVWAVSGALETALWVVFAAGWLLLLWSAISFDIFTLLGLRQVFAWVQGKPPPAPKLVTGGPYRMFRHPMYVGVLLGIWTTPHMTAGHVLIGAAFTAYILIARRYEERDLRQTFGCVYRT
jgi:protein-S-isoprenylcysteine O-methyltransferase Ste14